MGCLLYTSMEKDFDGYDRLLHLLRYEAPKMGNNEELPDSIAGDLLEAFARAVKGKKNERGGCFRAGTCLLYTSFLPGSLSKASGYAVRSVRQTSNVVPATA